MNKSQARLEAINPLLAKLVDGNNLSAIETEKLTETIYLYDKEGYHLATFVGAVHAKGETAEELLGLCLSRGKLGAKLKPKIPSSHITDVSGSGGGRLKTFNVSTTVSFVIVAAGYTVLKQAFYGSLSPTGSADIFATFGIDISTLNPKKVEKALEKVGICPLYLEFISPRLKNKGLLGRKIYVQQGVRVRTPFHVVTNAFVPVKMDARIYGMYSPRYLNVLAELFIKLGYKRTLTFYAEIGMPEISNVGKTIIVEQNGKKLKKYTVSPEDLGVKEAREVDIKTGGKEQNIKDFVNILRGKEWGPKADLVAVNAGAALYALGDVRALKDGTMKALEILKSGEPYRVFERLVNKIGTPSILSKF